MDYTAIKIYPELEDLTIIPEIEEQIFKSKKYGYDKVQVKAIESENLSIAPGKEEQNYVGMYKSVTVKGDNNLVSSNIREGTSIFNVKGTAKATTLNIFCQETEPENKDGIWLQGERTYNKVKFTDIVSSDPYWAYNNASAFPYAISTYSLNCVQKGAEIYILPYSGTGYRYNLVTGDIEKITYPTGCSVNNACLYNDDIYIFTYNNTLAFKYNTITKEFTQLSTPIPKKRTEVSEAVLVGKFIYLFGGTSSTINTKRTIAYKYSIEDDTYTELAPMPYSNLGGYAAKKIGEKIYIFGGSSTSNWTSAGSYMYEYDIASDSYTKKANLGSGYTHYFKHGQAQACVIGTDIYYFGSADTNSSNCMTKACKYDTIANVHTALPTIPRTLYGGVVAYYNNKIYLIGGDSNTKAITIMEFPSIEFDDNSVVIQTGVKYATQLISPPEITDGRVETSFKDVYYYTDSGGLDGTLTTYYGDGTTWNKFKN